MVIPDFFPVLGWRRTIRHRQVVPLNPVSQMYWTNSVSMI
jgi:hypothetical protein